MSTPPSCRATARHRPEPVTEGGTGQPPADGGPETVMDESLRLTETSLLPAHEHCQSLQDALNHFRESSLGQVATWGEHLATVLPLGRRLLAGGNGGSAAQAQHLTAELVGRYRDDRPAYSAISLHAETSSVTAIANDFGFEELYARQVAAHGRPGDVLLLMSTSGRSPNLLAAAEAAHAAGLLVWAMTGPRPNPLAGRAEETLSVESTSAATVQEAHLVVLHLLCEAFDAALATPDSAALASASPASGVAHSTDVLDVATGGRRTTRPTRSAAVGSVAPERG